MLTIVLTGPESSGKTTLASLLAEALHCPVAPEFARFYLGGLQQPYRPNDVHAIRRGQAAWENWYARLTNSFLICDTDHSVIDVWEWVKYGRQWSPHRFPGANRLYLLCAPDFPWQADPLREHPESRSALLQLYVCWLDDARATYCYLEGPAEQRLQKALAFVQQLP